MKFLEKDLEEILFNSDRKELSERGLPIHGKMYRQLRIGNYGIADLVTFTKETHIYEGEFRSHSIYVTIYELKKDKVGISTFLQAVGYLKGIDRYIRARNFKNISGVVYDIVLIGSSVDTSSTFSYLQDYLLNEECSYFLGNYTYSYDVDGIRFSRQHGYSLVNEGFGL